MGNQNKGCTACSIPLNNDPSEVDLGAEVILNKQHIVQRKHSLSTDSFQGKNEMKNEIMNENNKLMIIDEVYIL